MADGTVKWWNPEKGFGFIIADGDPADVFLRETFAGEFAGLDTGARVTFEIQHDPEWQRDEAINVVIVEPRSA